MDNQPTKITTRDRHMGFALLRVLLGINMLTRSLVRLPEVNAFASGMADGFADTFLPGPFVFGFAYVIVIAETIIGVMLILGWKTRWALVAMGGLLCALAFGMLLQENYGTAANIVVYAIAVSGLLFTTAYDHFGIDTGFSIRT